MKNTMLLLSALVGLLCLLQPSLANPKPNVTANTESSKDRVDKANGILISYMTEAMEKEVTQEKKAQAVYRVLNHDGDQGLTRKDLENKFKSFILDSPVTEEEESKIKEMAGDLLKHMTGNAEEPVSLADFVNHLKLMNMNMEIGPGKGSGKGPLARIRQRIRQRTTG